MQDVVILGAGGFAREVWWVFEDANADQKRWNVLGFIDENRENWGKSLCDLPVLGDFSWFEKAASKPRVISGVGGNPLRRKFAARAKEMGLEFCGVRHPSARLSRFVEVGAGTVICAGNAITTQIRIGAHVNINLNCTLGHDVTLDDYCNLSPGVHVSGNVHLEEGVDAGTGAVFIPGKRVGAWSVIGAGSVVTKDIPSRVVAVGAPAKPIRDIPADA
jgi:sugar O-acyltransferase (sialic acid O-acetyltransferase NeuD family)